MEIKGKLIEKFSTKQITDTFKKQEFVIEYAENSQYIEFIKFETIQDKCGQIDNYEVGSELIVAFNLKGRKWSDANGDVKYFNTLQAWKIQSDAPAPTPIPTEEMSEQEKPDSNNAEEADKDDLPF